MQNRSKKHQDSAMSYPNKTCSSQSGRRRLNGDIIKFVEFEIIKYNVTVGLNFNFKFTILTFKSK